MPALSRKALSVADFVASSRGAWIALESFLYFHTASGLTGYFLWADPSAEEITALSAIIDASLRLEPHPTLVDGRELRTPPLRYFEHMMRFFTGRRADLQRSVERLALIRPGGLPGVAASGFFSVITPPYPVELFESLAPALAWLGQVDAEGMAAELEELHASVRQVSPLLHRLRTVIDASLPHPEIDDVARRLGISERTLHRRLKEHGTSFGDEVGRARVALAQTLLRDTDTPITRVALDVGCASASSFTVLFRKWANTTPTAYRASARGSAEP